MTNSMPEVTRQLWHEIQPPLNTTSSPNFHHGNGDLFLFVKSIFRFPFVKEICLIKHMFLCMCTLTFNMFFIYIFVKQPSKSQGRREALKV